MTTQRSIDVSATPRSTRGTYRRATALALVAAVFAVPAVALSSAPAGAAGAASFFPSPKAVGVPGLEMVGKPSRKNCDQSKRCLRVSYEKTEAGLVTSSYIAEASKFKTIRAARKSVTKWKRYYKQDAAGIDVQSLRKYSKGGYDYLLVSAITSYGIDTKRYDSVAIVRQGVRVLELDVQRSSAVPVGPEFSRLKKAAKETLAKDWRRVPLSTAKKYVPPTS